MKVEIVNVETIKPSCPTPLHLKTYNLSVLDQVAPPFYTELVLLYKATNKNGRGGYDHFCQTLKNSLSATLTLFPPFAGKIKDNVSVDCNDDGVQCYETRVHSTLDQLLLHPNLGFPNPFTVGNHEANVHTDGQLFVKINLFDCGGIALGVSNSHKLCDAASFIAFFKSWSAKAMGSSGQVVVPNLTASTNFFQPRKEYVSDKGGSLEVLPPTPGNLIISTRLVFDGPEVDALKAKSASQSTPNPTRVEAVFALIGKCAMAASSKTNNNKISSYMFTHTINMRKMLTPSLPENTFGNVVGTYLASYSGHSDEACLDILVDKFRKGRMDYCDSLPILNAEKAIDKHVETMEMVAEMARSGDAVETYRFSSCCRFGFYDADFGIGKPIWVGIPGAPIKNTACLIDTKDGNGIQAQISLTEKNMLLFQADPLLLQYAYVNPAV